MPKLNKKVNLVFYQLLILGLVAGALSLVTIIKIWPAWFLLVHKWIYSWQGSCNCCGYGVFMNHPWLTSFMFLAGGLVLIWLIITVFKVLNLKLATDRFIKRHLARKISPSRKLILAATKLGLEKKVVEVESAEATIFCYGLWHPHICFSSAVVKRLDVNELKAVLKHEAYHLLTYEPLRLFWIKSIFMSLFFLPGIKFLYKNYLVLSELAADELAIVNFKQKIFLARALDKIIQFKMELKLKEELAVSFFDVIEERVDRLSGNWQAPLTRALNLRFIYAGMFFIVFLAIFNLAANLSQASVANYTTLGNKYYYIPVEKTACRLCVKTEACFDQVWQADKNYQSCIKF